MYHPFTPRLMVPTVVESTNRGERVYDIYSRLLRDRIVFIGAPIEEDLANAVVAQLLFLDYEDPERPINLYIHSPGGSITAGLAIYDTMQFIRPAVATIAVGQTASMATVLLAAGAAGQRFALPNARMHMHPAGVGQIGGYAPDIEIQARELLRTQARVHAILAQHTGQPIEKIAHDSERDIFMDAPQAVAYGLVDEILPHLPRNAPHDLPEHHSPPSGQPNGHPNGHTNGAGGPA
jgi:ATP-dependent Clp protease protease subunit